MPIEVVVPRSGWSMEEGIFAGWMKADGDVVKPGDRLFALESDKAVEEAESIDGGILRIPADAPKKGDVVKVGQILGYLLATGESLLGEPPAPVKGPVADADAKPAAGAPVELGADIGGDAPPAPVRQTVDRNDRSAPRVPLATSHSGARIGEEEAITGGPVAEGNAPGAAVTPRARRAAFQLGVDLGRVSGTGRAGRVRERDVLHAAPPRRYAASATLPGASPAEQVGGRSAGSGARAPAVGSPQGDGDRIPISSLRRMIAERMRHSQAETAAVTLHSRADATNLVALRTQFKKAADENSGPVPAFTDIIAKLAAIALKRHPLLGGRWEGDQILLPTAMNIGIAVDTEAGLLVPVLRDVLSLPLPELSRRSRALITAAQQRRIKTEDMQGGIFTITNLGSFGIDAFTPIINFPETAILGLGAIRREVVVLPDNHFGSREAITLSLTFDHRVVDGAPAARFLQTLCQGIENPSAWLLDISPFPS